MGFISVDHYEEFERSKNQDFPSTTRGGKELPSSSVLDSPSVLSKLATPTPAIDFDMSHVIDDATSAMHDAHDDTTSLLDNNVPLGEVARVRENEITETDDINESDDEDSPPRYEFPVIPEGYIMDEETTRDFFLAMIDMILRNC